MSLQGIHILFSEDLQGIELEDVQFIPIAASGRFDVSEQFGLGADIGYAIGVNDGNDGGFYYAPRISYSVSDAIDIVAAYRGVSRDGGSWDIVSLGVEFGIISSLTYLNKRKHSLPFFDIIIPC